MKKITLLALLCCICMSHAFADGFIETDGFTFTGHNHIVGEPKWKTLSNGGKVPVEAYVHAKDKSLSGSIRIT
ncbi:MAG: hypothetical protein IJ762_12325 [Bacteroidaceae bacterium]|nr:hypothetical protein [Bacteroidaceae bacterium]